MTLKGKITAGLMALFAACGMPGTGSAKQHASDGDSKTVLVSDRNLPSGGSNRTSTTERRGLAGEGGNSGRAGTGVDLPGYMKQWEVQSKDTGGTLLFSDSPEYVSEEGILYQDTVQGDARILYYHLNEMHSPHKVAVVLENMEKNHSAMVRITRGAAGKPSSDYLSVGKETQTKYFRDKYEDRFLVPGGSRHLLVREMDNILLQQGELVYGVYDFHADKPVKVSVVMCNAYEDPCKFVDKARILPKDEQRLRGTFSNMDRLISSGKTYNADRDGVVYFVLADDKYDAYRTGIDATDGSQVTDYGNYGILYKIDVPVKGNAHIQYYLEPMGGVYAGAMNVRHGKNSKMDLILTPDWNVFFGEGGSFYGNRELAYLGGYDSKANAHFEFSPPGASNLPVRIIMMPEKKPDNNMKKTIDKGHSDVYHNTSR